MAEPRFELRGDIKPGMATKLAGFLADNPGDVLVVINSGGGSATDGAEMMAEIERHGRVMVLVQGVAASAATLPMVAAREVVIHSAAVVMIHEPSAWGGGTAAQLRETAETLDKMSMTYAEAYARHTGHPVERIAAWMKAETWLNAGEAVALHFCDRIEGAAAESITAAASDYTKFQQAPSELVDLARANGWAMSSPDQKYGEKNV